MTHDDNLARVQALRDAPRLGFATEAACDHIEDVLTRHAPQVTPLSKVAHCLPCWGMPPFPCPRTDRAAWRIYDQHVRTHTVSVQDRDRVRLAVVRDWLACR